MVVDTGVFIDFLRGYQPAARFLSESQKTIGISRLTLMELIRGAASKREQTGMFKQLKNFRIEIIEVNSEISKHAGDLFVAHWLSKSIGIIDCFIAATALITGEPLMARNVRHFRPIEGLDLHVPY